jgi:hypothetical protein
VLNNVTWRKYGSSIYTSLHIDGVCKHGFSYVHKPSGWAVPNIACFAVGSRHFVSTEAEAEAWILAQYVMERGDA